MTCAGSCGIRNSVCSQLASDPYAPVCLCSYCNFDASTKKCIGSCNTYSASTCISLIKTPKSDNNCSCYTCADPTFDSKGRPKCSGKCANSGLMCKPSTTFRVWGVVDICTCQ